MAAEQQRPEEEERTEAYRHIPFDQRDRAFECLQEDGVVVIEGVFTPGECSDFCDQIAQSLAKLCPQLAPRDKKTWTQANLPSGPRSGLFQSLVANFPVVWEIRSDPRIRQIFTSAYSGLRGYPVEEFFSSLDGINVRPHKAPFQEEENPHKYTDWAHLDQTLRKNRYWCIQGQVVLSDTTACFRASPKSHLIYEDLLDINDIPETSKSNWCKFRPRNIPQVRKKIEEAGGAFQVPVRTKRGSMILWLSSTVHSAMTQLRSPLPKLGGEIQDPWRDWRFVVYTCYRPKNECDKGHGLRLTQALRENRVTNHSGMKIFPKKLVDSYEAHLQQLLNDPEKAFRLLPLELTPEIKELTRF